MTTAVTRARRASTPFSPGFFHEHVDFWPIARAARTFERYADWPEVADYARAFVGAPPVRFELSVPKPRRQKRALDLDTMYDARIVGGVVPTRARCWHDFSNALVWATFPAAKRALHERQHRAILAWVPAGATRLPGARSREMDALALLDEGGVVQVGERSVVFGHALYEGAVLLSRAETPEATQGPRRVVARQVLELEPVASESDAALVARVDAALEQLLRATALTPEVFVHARRLFAANSHDAR